MIKWKIIAVLSLESNYISFEFVSKTYNVATLTLSSVS